jgi:hypothetical protein
MEQMRTDQAQLYQSVQESSTLIKEQVNWLSSLAEKVEKLRQVII